MEKRVIIAVVLSILVIMLWHKFSADMYPPAQVVSPIEKPDRIIEEEVARDIETSRKEGLSQLEKKAEEKHVFETEKFLITLSNIGGCIKNIVLKEYKDGEGDGFYNLISEDKAGRGIFTITSQELNLDKDLLFYQLKTDRNVLEYSTVVAQKIKIIKRYIFNDKDIINFEIKFENTDTQIHTFGYDIVGGVNIEAKEPFADRYIQVDAKVNDNIYRDRSARNKILLHSGAVQWAALKNKYFVTILKPLTAANASFIRKYEDRALAAGIRMADVSVSPGSSVTHNFLLYAGPKKRERLASVGMGFEEVMYYGIFGSISKLLLSVLRFFYKFTRNWGISIIILSGLINLCLYPLTRKSLKSMQNMQAVQPEIKELQDKYKKNPQKLNKEIMELYKKYKINPLGGCFPMLLQMPVFIALYQGLMRFIELKNAHFLWIKDLSMPDSVKLLFLGGKSIHILPILMAGMMFLQQQFSHPQHQTGMTEQQRQQQKMMAVMMPLLFGFIFYNFPSGLVLYWFTNTVFMTLNQILMLKKAV